LEPIATNPLTPTPACNETNTFMGNGTGPTEKDAKTSAAQNAATNAASQCFQNAACNTAQEDQQHPMVNACTGNGTQWTCQVARYYQCVNP
jgi:hypothetical protein